MKNFWPYQFYQIKELTWAMHDWSACNQYDSFTILQNRRKDFGSFTLIIFKIMGFISYASIKFLSCDLYKILGSKIIANNINSSLLMQVILRINNLNMIISEMIDPVKKLIFPL